jgi:peptidoglycan/xylan/chitin deacetylase (PgdA/CDA1 family)
MLLKRSLALALGLLLFIGGFFVYFQIIDMRLEERFHQERLKFGVEGNLPIASIPDAGPTPSQPSPVPNSAASTAPSAAPDTNVIIGPLPPSTTPDSAPAPATPATPTPAPADSNSAPMAPSSTMVRPRLNSLSFLVFTAYMPSKDMQIQASPVQPTPLSVPPPPLPPATNSSTNGTAATTGTNNEPSSPPATNETLSAASPTNSGTPRPVPVEASVIVLGYHQFVGPGQSSRNPYVMRQDVFQEEMKYLKDNGYHVVPLADVVRFIKHEIGLPPNSVAITIDDGYKSAIVWAAPVLKQYGYPWTYFVYPDFITVNEGKGAASWNDLLALQADGVDIECHSMTHPILTSRTQKFKGSRHTLSADEYDEFLTNETAGAKALLEQKLGKPVPYFAYPYGAYNKQVEAKAIAAGYDAIFTVADNPVHSTTDKNSVGRYIITQPVERAFASYLRQGALSIADASPAPGTITSEARPVITAVLGYAGTLDPKSIETDVRDFGAVRHDFDPKTATVRLYLPRDLIQPVNLVNIRVKDAETGQVMVANWHFNYDPATAAVHPPITATNAAPSTNTAPLTNSAPATNAPPVNHSVPEAAPNSVPSPETTTSSSSSSKNPGSAR